MASDKISSGIKIIIIHHSGIKIINLLPSASIPVTVKEEKIRKKIPTTPLQNQNCGFQEVMASACQIQSFSVNSKVISKSSRYERIRIIIKIVLTEQLAAAGLLIESINTFSNIIFQNKISKKKKQIWLTYKNFFRWCIQLHNRSVG